MYIYIYVYVYVPIHEGLADMCHAQPIIKLLSMIWIPCVYVQMYD